MSLPSVPRARWVLVATLAFCICPHTDAIPVDPYNNPYGGYDPFAAPVDAITVTDNIVVQQQPGYGGYPSSNQYDNYIIQDTVTVQQYDPYMQYQPAPPPYSPPPYNPPPYSPPPYNPPPYSPPPYNPQPYQPVYQPQVQETVSVSTYVVPTPPPPPPPPVSLDVDTYLAVTVHDKAHRKHCGIIPVTNDEIYSSDPVPGGINDVLPYGAFHWNVAIVDLDDYTVPCLGTQIHSELVLTSRRCIVKPAGRYTIIRDWDILTSYNEYEAYKSYADPVCTYWPIGLDNSTSIPQYQIMQAGGAYGYDNAELVLLISPLEEHHDKYPADKLLCLPSRLSAPPQPAYGYPAPPPMYSPYPQISYDPYPIPTGECWVAGWLNSPTAVLQNHPNPTPVDPMIAQQQQQRLQNQYNVYYNNLDNSKVPRRALVRQIACPGDRPYPGSDDVCFVGVSGYDACVADQGTAIVCIIDDDTEYQSGFSDDNTSDHGNLPAPPGTSAGNAPYMTPNQPNQPYQSQPIQVAPSPPKPKRRRGVLYGVVKTTTTCMAPSYSAPNSYSPQQQSNYIVGARVNPGLKTAIQDKFWQGGYDLACPTAKVSEVLPSIDSISNLGQLPNRMDTTLNFLPPMPQPQPQPQVYEQITTSVTENLYAQPIYQQMLPYGYSG